MTMRYRIRSYASLLDSHPFIQYHYQTSPISPSLYQICKAYRHFVNHDHGHSILIPFLERNAQLDQQSRYLTTVQVCVFWRFVVSSTLFDGLSYLGQCKLCNASQINLIQLSYIGDKDGKF